MTQTLYRYLCEVFTPKMVRDFISPMFSITKGSTAAVETISKANDIIAGGILIWEPFSIVEVKDKVANSTSRKMYERLKELDVKHRKRNYNIADVAHLGEESA